MIRAFRWQAMGTDYELYLVEPDERHAEAIAGELREEVQRLERQLSLYQPDSDLNYLNAHAAREPVRVEPGLFQLLQTSKTLWEQTEGAFDPTVTPLLRLWGFVDRCYRVPSPDEIANALERVGMEWVLLEPEGRWVYYAREGVELSFGAIGKGWAVDSCVRRLKQLGVQAALLSAGGSTFYALGAPPDADGWRVEIPPNPSLSPSGGKATPNPSLSPSGGKATPNPPLSPACGGEGTGEGASQIALSLRDRALSTSGGSEQFFEVDGVRYAHILDPRTGYPANACHSVSVSAPNATLSDALSTAFFVGGQNLIARWQQHDDSIEVF